MNLEVKAAEVVDKELRVTFSDGQSVVLTAAELVEAEVRAKLFRRALDLRSAQVTQTEHALLLQCPECKLLKQVAVTVLKSAKATWTCDCEGPPPLLAFSHSE